MCAPVCVPVLILIGMSKFSFNLGQIPLVYLLPTESKSLHFSLFLFLKCLRSLSQIFLGLSENSYYLTLSLDVAFYINVS